MRASLLPTALAAVALAAGCSDRPASQPASAPAAGEAQLNVYMWSEYIDPAICEAFEGQTGIKVRLDYYESTEEMMAKLQQAGGDTQYDVVVASDHAIPVLASAGTIRQLDAAKLPNLANVAQGFREAAYDHGCRTSVPYQWGTMGLVYRKDKLPDLEPSWAVVLDPAKQPGPLVLIDSMRDMLAATLKFQGKSVNSRSPEDLRAAGEQLLKAKHSPKTLGFEGGAGGKNKVASSDCLVAVAYNGDAIRAIAEDPGIGFLIPREGTLIWVDAMTIPARAPHPEQAYRFINHILDAEVGAQLSDFNRYATPNQASLPLIRAEDRANPIIYPADEVRARMEYIEDVGADTRLYDEVWTAVKSR